VTTKHKYINSKHGTPLCRLQISSGEGSETINIRYIIYKKICRDTVKHNVIYDFDLATMAYLNSICGNSNAYNYNEHISVICKTHIYDAIRLYVKSYYQHELQARMMNAIKNEVIKLSGV
jgi:hypothetical protein